MIALVGVVYVVCAVDLFYMGRIGLSVTFLGYAIGNLGLWAVAHYGS